MDRALAWARRRPVTLALCGFLVGWYLVQLLVYHRWGAEFAEWLFYFERPPDHRSPGMALSSISHRFGDLRHVGANVPLLLVAGSLAEPHIGRRRVLWLVVGLGYLGTYLANATAILHGQWMIAGASGGILALWAYTGIHQRHQLRVLVTEGASPLTRRGGETLTATIILVSIPLIPVYEVVVVGQFHSGHTVGLLLGGGYLGYERWFA